jgi:hypothetical protein
MTYRLVEYYAGERAGWSHVLSFLTAGLQKQNLAVIGTRTCRPCY